MPVRGFYDPRLNRRYVAHDAAVRMNRRMKRRVHQGEPPPAGITFVAGATGGTATDPITITWPGGLAADDVALVFWTMQSTTVPTTPSGFTLVTNNDGGAGSIRTYIYRDVLAGSESGSLTLTCNLANRHSACLVIYRGCDPTTPVDGTPSVDTAHTTGTTHNNPAYTPTQANCVILTSIHERATNIDTAWTAPTTPTTYTERADTLTLATGSGGTITAVADDGLAAGRDTSAVTPGVWTGNHGTGTGNIVTYTLALRPLVVGGGTDHTVDQTDDAGLTDSWAFEIDQAVTDAAGLTDTTALALSQTQTDDTGLTDTPTVQVVKDVTQTDSTGLTDTAERLIGQAQTDSAGLTDNQATQQAKAQTDSAGLTDTAAVELSKLLTQTDDAGLTDSAFRTVAQVVTDTTGLTDTAALSRSATQTDSAGLTDTSTVVSGKTLDQTDSAGLTDTPALRRDLVSTDSAGLTDAVAAALSKTQTDSAGLTDTSTADLIHGVAATDSAGLTDTWVLTRAASITDLAGLTDTAALDRLAVFTDLAGLADAAGLVVTGTGPTLRPNTGTTTRPSSGITVRPFTTVTPRP